MSDNEIINASMASNNDWMFLVLAVIIGIVALLSHLNARRWVISGGVRVCGHCVKKYRRARRQGVNIGIAYSPSQSDLPCMDCQRGK
jgi:hypothetical protein